MVAPSLDRRTAPRRLRRHLDERLPGFMVPRVYIILPAIPQTPNGKVDRRALPAPERGGQRPGYQPPRTATETRLARIWQRSLKVERVGRQDEFFELGGHSLLAARTLATLSDELADEGIEFEIPIATLFETPSLAAFAARLDRALATERPPVESDPAPRRSAPPPILHADRSQPLPPSFAQRRLWFLDQLEPGSPLYNIAAALSLQGRLCAQHLAGALNDIVERHEVLRTHFGALRGRPVQRIRDFEPSPLPLLDLSALRPEARKIHEARLRRRQARLPFWLARGPLYRFCLLRTGEHQHTLCLSLHHTVADGGSLELFLRELATHYAARLARKPSPLPSLPRQYADFAAWQRRQLKAAGLAARIEDWRRHLAGAPPLLELPTDRPRPAVRSQRGTTLPIHGPRRWAAALRQLEPHGGTTSFIVLTAAFLALLHRYSGATDLVIGAPFTHRPRDTEELLGFFVNTLALRVQLDPEPPVDELSFLDLVRRTRSETLAAHQRQDLPFEQVVERLAPRRDLAYAPLFQVVFAYQQTAEASFSLPGLKVELLPVATGTAKFDLTLSLTEFGPRMEGYLETSDDLWDATTGRRFWSHFRTLLDAAIEAPATPLSLLPLLGASERHQLNREWSGSGEVRPLPGTIDHRLAQQARTTPDAIALCAQDENGREQQLSYRELDRRGSRLAHRLATLGVSPGDTVALLSHRSLDLVVALVATLRAGAAYVPLDPSYPRQRLAFLLSNAAPAALLTEERWRRLPPASMPVEIPVASLRQGRSFAESPSAPEKTDPTTDHRSQPSTSYSSYSSGLAYVVYTSGSTGQPKGVAVSHRAVLRLVRDSDYIDLSPGQSFLQLAPIAFDASTLELWGPLLNGGRLNLPPPGRLSLDEIEGQLLRHRVTTLWLTSGLFHQMVESNLAGLAGVRQLLSGGDVLSVAHVQRALGELDNLGKLVLFNAYGPTENTTFTTYHRMRRGEPRRATVPIGRPIPRSEVFLLDRHMEPVPTGVTGELWIGGAGLAQGYHRWPARTALRFRPDPRPTLPGARLYRSGDLARYLADGKLDFLGRADHQVKIRGYRIELGEIQTLLATHPRVGETAVVARHDGPAGKRLVAYVVAATAGEILDSADLRSFLSHQLPEYMLPSAWVTLPELPLTANGKLDRRALPAPEQIASRRAQPKIAPRTATERQVAEWFAELLAVEPPSVDEDFFELGGHSLLATQLIARVSEALAVKLPLQEIFAAPTVASFALRIDAARGGADGHAGGASPAPPPLTRRPRAAEPALSFAQERLWFLDQLQPNSAFYNIAAAFRVRGALRIPTLQQALSAVVARHEALRTLFPIRHGRPFQQIQPPFPVALPMVDLSRLKPTARGRQRDRLAHREAARPFQLTTGPLLRVTLLRLQTHPTRGGDHALLITLHHIAGDGWSVGIFTRELASLYRAELSGEAARLLELPELPIQYADFAAWQRGWLQGATLDALLDFWRPTLAGAPALLDLPTDRPRPAAQSLRGATFPFRFDRPLVAAIDHLAQRAKATRFMVLMALFGALIQRWSGRSDLVLGTPVANREEAALEGLIGFFVNTLPIRLDLGGDPTLAALLARVREATLAAFAHQQIPFEKLVEELAERDPAHTPLFQLLITLQNGPATALDLPGLSFEPLAVDTGAVKLDLALAFDEERWLRDGAGGLAATFDYCLDLFDRTTLHRLAGQFITLARGCVEAGSLPATASPPLSALPLLSAAERHQLREWNDTVRDQGGRWLPALFEEQAARTPELPALLFADRQISYRQLNSWANRWAHRLLALGIGAEDRVGICAERAPEVIAAFLGVVKAGAAYVPFDPAYPRQRLAFMLRDSGVRLVLSQPWFEERFPAPGVQTLALDSLAAPAAGHDDAAAVNPSISIRGDQLAYAIYTSGSTGEPKGVLVHHRGLANLCLEIRRRWRLKAGDRHLTFNSLAFDASASNVYPVLLAGAALVIHPTPSRLTGQDLERFCQSQGITVLDVPPAFWTQWLREMTVDRGRAFLPRLRQLTLGGDSVALDKLRRWTALTEGRITLFGPYGPTEATIGSTWAATADGREIWANAQRLPIGRPFANTEILLLDRRLWPQPVAVPVGAEGEIAIAGDGLARGYLGRPALSAARFVPHPSSPTPGARLYRTGDLARWLPDGNLEFLGRADSQVKIRGFRIELGEIEAALRTHPEVREAVVVARRRTPEDRRLVAYLVSGAPQPPTASQLRAFLGERLPTYMVPAVFALLDALPIGPTGKVNLAALPEPNWSQDEDERPYRAPRSATERSLAAIWSELLGAERVGLDDNFFDLGGHSLLATQVVSRLRQRWSVELPVQSIFEAPTLAGLAVKVETARGEEASAGANTARGATPPLVAVARDGRAPMSFSQQRLWFLDQLDSASALYNVPGPFRLRGPLRVAVLRRAVREIVARHEVLRTTFALAEGEPVQRISPARAAAPLAIPWLDLSALAATTREARLTSLVAREARRPFDLARGPLLRLTMVRLAPEEHAALLTLHHIVSDGWSLALFMSELAALYRHFTGEGGEFPLAPLAIQYADFAAWQRDWLSGERLEEEIATWRGWLETAPTILDLPTDRPRPPVASNRGASLHFELPTALAQAARATAHQLGATLFMVLLATFETLLYRYSGQDDLLVGVGVANRDRIEIEPLIGFFVNTLVLRGRLGGNPTFEELIEQVRASSLAAFAHQEMPFDKLVEGLDLARDLSRMPLVQVAFVLQNAPLPERRIGELELAPIEVDTGTAKFDLLLALVDREPGLLGAIEYNRDLFDRSTIERLLGHFERLLAAFAAQPATRIEEVPLFTRELAAAIGSPVSEIERSLPLNPTQRDLYLDYLLAPESTLYSLGLSAPLSCDLDPALWERAVRLATAGEEVARLRFASLRGVAHQLLLRRPERLDEASTAEQVHFEQTELATEPGSLNTPASLDNFVAQRVKVAYDLARGPLWHNFLLHHPSGEYTALVAFPHLVADAYSGKLFFERVSALYRVLASGDSPSLDGTASFLDTVGSQLARFDTARVESAWRQRLAGQEPVELYTGVDRSARASLATATLRGARREAVAALCREHGWSSAAFLRALWAVLLHRLFGATGTRRGLLLHDVVGSRSRQQSRVVGCLYQVIPVVITSEALADERPAKRLIDELRHYRRGLGEEQNISVLLQRRLLRSGGLRFFYNFYNFTQLELATGAATQPSTLRVHDSFPDEEVHLIVQDQGDRLQLTVHWNERRFADLDLPRRLLQLCDALTTGDPALGALPTLLPAEREQIRGWHRRTAVAYDELSDPAAATLPRLLATQTERTPEATALLDHDRQLSYAELDRRARRLAARLRARGVGAETTVALLAERSLEMVVALVAILKAGGAYLPLDPDYPAKRLALMVEDSAAALVLSQPHLRTRLEGTALDSLAEERWLELPAKVGHEEASASALPGEASIDPRQPAYVIYTSGSTGRPKGVVISHQAIVNRLLWMQESYPLDSSDTVLQKTPYSFDVSVWEFFWPLLVGARLAIARPEGHKDNDYLRRHIARQQVTTLHFVPSMLRLFLDGVGQSDGGAPQRLPLRRVMASGEALSADLVRRFRRRLDCPLHNLYGPTEAAVDVTAWTCPPRLAGSTVPIGKAIANTAIYIVDRRLEALPAELPGELLIGGAGLARGYLGRAALSAERFVPDGLSGLAGQRLYRTGDLARYRQDGEIEFLGRIDFQVKIRGFRIELGEVEAALGQHPAIAASVVVAQREGAAGDHRLIAYYARRPAELATAQTPLPADELRRALGRTLPDHMVPSLFIELAALPLSANGKIDRRALPEPEGLRPELERGFVAPRGERERELARVWQRALRLDRVGIHDNFFDLGGHSLLLAQVLADLQQASTASGTGVQITMVDLFQHPTIAALAEFLEERTSDEGQARASAQREQRGQRRKSRARQRRGALRRRARFEDKRH